MTNNQSNEPENREQTFDEKLSNALALIKYSIEYADTHGGCPPAVKSVKRHGVAEARQAIKTLVLEDVVGEDEPHYDTDRITQNAQRQRNLLKAEQRQIINPQKEVKDE